MKVLNTAVVTLAASIMSQIEKFRELANEGNKKVIPVIVKLQDEFDKLQKLLNLMLRNKLYLIRHFMINLDRK